MVKKQGDYVWNPATCNYEYGKYLASIMDDSAITCDELNAKLSPKDDEEKANFNKKQITCITQNFRILIAFFINKNYNIDSY